MKRQLILLIFIAFIAISTGAPTSGKEESEQNKTPEDSTSKWWNFIRENVLYPTFNLITEGSKDDDRDFKSASNENISISIHYAQTEGPIEPPKIFSYLDDAVYEIANLTFLGYIYIGLLVIILVVLICCTGCCCCCCGCCGGCRR
uniref:Uncharacterized protein n=1 Tax=Panagrolaimus sp. ES5 TaxID=591445 RepID=A0AC34G537_9BILA